MTKMFSYIILRAQLPIFNIEYYKEELHNNIETTENVHFFVFK